MGNLNKWVTFLSLPAVVFFSVAAVAQHATDSCKPPSVIPLANGDQPPAMIVIDAPLAEPLASRGVVIIHYCAENLHIVPVFGPNAVATKYASTWLTQTTIRSTNAQSLLLFLKGRPPKRINEVVRASPCGY